MNNIQTKLIVRSQKPNWLKRAFAILSHFIERFIDWDEGPPYWSA